MLNTRPGMTITRRDLTFPDCEMICKTAGVLSIHIKRMHRQATTSFSCGKSQTEFKSGYTLKNHHERCRGERKVGSSTRVQRMRKKQHSHQTSQDIGRSVALPPPKHHNPENTRPDMSHAPNANIQLQP